MQDERVVFTTILLVYFFTKILQQWQPKKNFYPTLRFISSDLYDIKQDVNRNVNTF